MRRRKGRGRREMWKIRILRIKEREWKISEFGNRRENEVEMVGI